MNKAELAAKVADRLGVAKKMGEDFVAAFEEIVTESLMDGEEVTIAGFGTFSARLRAGRMGVNPQNPSERIQIPAVTVPKFKAGKALKDALKGKGKFARGKTEDPSPAPSMPTPPPAAPPSPPQQPMAPSAPPSSPSPPATPGM